MCGICGIYNYATDRPLDRDVLARMTRALVHRGPDDEGFHVSADGRLGLGFRRLSIVDLAGGHQPMCNEDGTAWLAFNGEIYNHRELRPDLIARGHVYRTQSDTETILHQWEESGDDFPNRLQGMFAIALHDVPRRRLLLVRDRIGIKPLYYVDLGGVFLFASEIKALLQHPDVPRRLNRSKVGEYLAGLAVAPPDTLFEGIHKLRAGHSMAIHDATGQEPARRYWNPLDARSEPPITDAMEGAERVRELLADSVRARLMSDVPFGVFLSGGIDSSAILAFMSRSLERPVETFTVGYKDDPGFNEFEFARKVAGLFKANHHEVLIDHADFQAFLPKLIYHQDEPISDPVCVPLYHVAKLARDSGVIVTLVGEGSDEIFYGYDWYNRLLKVYEKWWKPLSGLPGSLRSAAVGLASPFVDAPRRDFLKRFAAGEEMFQGGVVTFFPNEQADLLAPDLLAVADPPGGPAARLYEELRGRVPDDDFMTRSTYVELMYRLPELLLMRVDKMTMATSVEGRVPFLDYRMIELSFRLANDLKVREGVGKWVLREALKSVLPPEILNRPKQGFHVPVNDWFGSRLAPYARQVLLHEPGETAQLFNRAAVEALLERHERGGGNLGMRIWALVNFALWHRYWIEGKPIA